MKKKLYALVNSLTVIAIMFFVLTWGGCSPDEDTDTDETVVKEKVEIGVLIPLTGSGPLQGEPEKAAIDIALEDVNDYLADKNSNKVIEVKFADTKFDSFVIMDALEEMNNGGIKILTFTGVSENLYLAKSYIDNAGMLVINQTSTAPSLSVEDGIFRLVPDDNYLSKVMAEVIWQEGIENMVFLYRDDLWGTELAGAIKSAFEAKGGAVITMISYDSRTSGADFDSKILELNDAITQALTTISPGKLAVQLICFEDGVEILKKASAYSSLSEVKWYGSDGFVQNEDLLEDETAVEFAEKVGVISPIIGEFSSDRYLAIKDEIAQKIGYTPYSWALVLYDAFWVAALTRVDAGYNNDIEVLKQTLESVLSTYDAITGDIELNEAGDRINCAYDFWGVTNENGSYRWKKILTYQLEDDQLIVR